MLRLAAAALMLALAAVSAAAFVGSGVSITKVPVTAVGGPASECTPGTATGEMDFSVCSNIAITAALW